MSAANRATAASAAHTKPTTRVLRNMGARRAKGGFTTVCTSAAKLVGIAGRAPSSGFERLAGPRAAAFGAGSSKRRISSACADVIRPALSQRSTEAASDLSMESIVGDRASAGWRLETEQTRFAGSLVGRVDEVERLVVSDAPTDPRN